MRPPGEVRMALRAAAAVGPSTLRELAQRSLVGYDAARDTVRNMSRAGELRVVDERHVAYRNRLVQVYELAAPVAVATSVASVEAEGSGPGFCALEAVFTSWLD
jgi:hypothetical protein